MLKRSLFFAVPFQFMLDLHIYVGICEFLAEAVAVYQLHRLSPAPCNGVVGLPISLIAASSKTDSSKSY